MCLFRQMQRNTTGKKSPKELLINHVKVDNCPECSVTLTLIGAYALNHGLDMEESGACFQQLCPKGEALFVRAMYDQLEADATEAGDPAVLAEVAKYRAKAEIRLAVRAARGTAGKAEGARDQTVVICAGAMGKA